ncbi:MAG: alpha-L-fucosidase [Endozoicomonas sp.]
MINKTAPDATVKYQPDWDSLKQYQVPDWFRDAKVGIFIHWGVYSVPAAYNEWYPRDMYMRLRDSLQNLRLPGNPRVRWHHKRRHGPTSEFGYKDFIPEFKAENWNPEEWLDHFENWGARYIMPVGEHHDGFPMFDSRFTEWNAARMGPKRDICRELAKGTRQRGLKFTISTHRAWNWCYYHFHKGDDTMNPANAGLYGKPHKTGCPPSTEFVENWFERVKEMIDEFHPAALYFDFGWHHKAFESYRPKVLSYYYNHAEKHGYEPVLNYKDMPESPAGSAEIPDGLAVLDVERGGLNDIREEPWQTCTSVSYKSWGYIENDNFRTPTALIHDLIDIVSKNGNLLINVGPRPDGTIPREAIEPLNEMGEWLKVNGEGIYGTRPWRCFHEGKVIRKGGSFSEKPLSFTAGDFRFTRRGENTVYAFAMSVPENRQLELVSFQRYNLKIRDVSLLGSAEKPDWQQANGKLRLTLPPELPTAHASVLKITLSSAV